MGFRLQENSMTLHDLEVLNVHSLLSQECYACFDQTNAARDTRLETRYLRVKFDDEIKMA